MIRQVAKGIGEVMLAGLVGGLIFFIGVTVAQSCHEPEPVEYLPIPEHVAPRRE